MQTLKLFFNFIFFFFCVCLTSGYSNSIFPLDNQNCSDTPTVGGKTATLHKLIRDLKINIPKGFNVSVKIYDEYLKSIKADVLIQKLDELSLLLENGNDSDKQHLEMQIEQISNIIRSKILNGNLEENHILEINHYYQQLDLDDENILVSVRSSGTAEDLKNSSFAGQYESYLNQKGLDQIVESIKKVWASTYTYKAVNYRNRNKVLHAETKMAVLVQQMIDAQSSGRAYSVDIETGASFVTIKSLYGLGEAEASGISSPDNWVINPSNYSIIKRCLGNKQYSIEYNFEKKITETLENSIEKQKQYVLSFEQVKELAQVIDRVHKYFLKEGIIHIEIEFAYSRQGELFITQARAETSWGKNQEKAFKAVDLNKIDSLHPIIFEGGVMGWGGVSVGILRIIHSLEEAKERHKKGDILVVGNTTNAWENIMIASNAIISEENVLSSHAVATTREEGIPSLIGIPNAREILKPYDSKFVTVDATSKRIFLGEIPDSWFFVPKEIKTTMQKDEKFTLEEHWRGTFDVNLGQIDAEGFRWLYRPVAGRQHFQHEINRKAYEWICANEDLPILEKIKIEDNNFYVSFFESHYWHEILNKRKLDYFERIYNERLKVNQAYLQACLDLEYNAESIKKWIEISIKFFGMQHISFSLNKIIDGFLDEVLIKKELQEPYLSHLRPAMEAFYSESLSKERTRFARVFLAKMSDDPTLLEEFRGIAEDKKDGELNLITNHPSVYLMLESYAKNYRMDESFSIDFSESWQLRTAIIELLKNYDNDQIMKVNNSHLDKEEFFPNDKEFQRIARLAILSHKLKLDTHHLRCRGHWKFREFILPFADFLKNKNVISEFTDIFDHEPNWLVEQFEEYKDEINEDFLKFQRSENFQMIPYKTFFIERMD